MGTQLLKDMHRNVHSSNGYNNQKLVVTLTNKKSSLIWLKKIVATKL